MNYFFFVQGIDFLGWIMLILSYYRKNENEILLFQIMATILFVIHYYLLGAYTGVFVCLFEVFRDYLYYKSDKDRIVFCLLIPMQMLFLFFSYRTLCDLLPIVSSLIDGYTLTFERKVIVLGGIFSYFLWIVYDLSVGSYVGAVMDLILVLSNFGILFFQKSIISQIFSRSIFPKK